MTKEAADFHADQIEPNSITADAARSEPDAQADDDKRWLQTALSLNTRSRAAREAPDEALLNDHDAVIGSMPLLAPFFFSDASASARKNP